MSTETEVKTYSLAEIAKHNSNQSTWIIIHNNVYDLSVFLNEVSGVFGLFVHIVPFTRISLANPNGLHNISSLSFSDGISFFADHHI